MSQIPVPDVTRELAEVWAMFEVFRAVKRFAEAAKRAPGSAAGTELGAD